MTHQMVTRWRGRSVLSHFVELFPRWLSGKDSAYQSMQETQETWVWSLGGEDSLEEEMATHSLRIPWRGAWWDIVHGVTKSWTRLSNLACTWMIYLQMYIFLLQNQESHCERLKATLFSNPASWIVLFEHSQQAGTSCQRFGHHGLHL